MQPSRGVLIKRCSENTQQIYRRTPMPKYTFNKVPKQLYWNQTSAECSRENLLHISRRPFPKNTSARLLLSFATSNCITSNVSAKDFIIASLVTFLITIFFFIPSFDISVVFVLIIVTMVTFSKAWEQLRNNYSVVN